MLGQSLGRRRRERRDTVEPEQAFLSAESRRGPVGELLEPGKFEVSAVSGEQFDLTFGDRVHAREP